MSSFLIGILNWFARILLYGDRIPSVNVANKTTEDVPFVEKIENIE